MSDAAITVEMRGGQIQNADELPTPVLNALMRAARTELSHRPQEPRAERNRVKTLLRILLSPGPVTAAEGMAWAKANQISPTTLRRAFAELRVRAVKEGPIRSGQRTWLWRLRNDAIRLGGHANGVLDSAGVIHPREG